MISIISGPSCAGKSMLLTNSCIIEKLTGVSSSAPVIFPNSLSDQKFTSGLTYLFHYNILRHADFISRNRAAIIDPYTAFACDPRWKELLALPYPKKAIVLVVSYSTLVKRMSIRSSIEPAILGGNNSRPYPRKRWIELLSAVDLDELYQAWCRELQKNGIPFVLVDSSDASYTTIEPHQLQCLRLNGNRLTSHSSGFRKQHETNEFNVRRPNSSIHEKQEPKENIVIRAWNGNFGLAMTYWVYGIVAGFSWGIALTALQPEPGSGTARLFLTLMSGYFIVIYVGIWRAANKYEGRRTWVYLAKFAVVLGALVTMLPGVASLFKSAVS